MQNAKAFICNRKKRIFFLKGGGAVPVALPLNPPLVEFMLIRIDSLLFLIVDCDTEKQDGNNDD